jgi:hypothetical protein
MSRLDGLLDDGWISSNETDWPTITIKINKMDDIKPSAFEPLRVSISQRVWPCEVVHVREYAATPNNITQLPGISTTITAP